ncbi:unnamed protein product [Closterium sp. NIES-54]
MFGSKPAPWFAGVSVEPADGLVVVPSSVCRPEAGGGVGVVPGEPLEELLSFLVAIAAAAVTFVAATAACAAAAAFAAFARPTCSAHCVLPCTTLRIARCCTGCCPYASAHPTPAHCCCCRPLRCCCAQAPVQLLHALLLLLSAAAAAERTAVASVPAAAPELLLQCAAAAVPSATSTTACTVSNICISLCKQPAARAARRRTQPVAARAACSHTQPAASCSKPPHAASSLTQPSRAVGVAVMQAAGEVEVVGVVVGVEAVEVVVGAAEALGAVEGAAAAVGEEGAVVALVVRASSSRSSSSISVSARPPLPSSFLTGPRAGRQCTGFHTEQRCFARLSDAWRAKFPDAPEFPNWADLLRRDVPIFDLDYEAILAAIYALSVSAEGDCYLCVPPDPGIAPGIAPAALGACESAPLGTVPAQALHTFTLDSGASRCFFRDSTTVTPLPAPVPVSLADPSGGPVLARSSTVPCPAVPSGKLSGLHLPSFSTNLVSNAVLQDAGIHTFTPGRQRVAICMCSQTGRHLATFAHAPGSTLYTLTTASRSAPLSPQLHASAQVATQCECRRLSHDTLLWHHRLGHPSLPRLRSMHSRFLVSGLPRSLPPLPLSPAPPCIPCVEGRQRAAPHSSSFPPTEAPLQTLHLDTSWQPSVRSTASARLSRFRPLRSMGLVMEVARTSMIHAAAPHFLWPFAVRYAAHQLNLWPRVSLPETSPTLLWTGKVGDVSRFRVWGARAFVRDTTADKLSPRAIPCVFLGFVPNAPGWQFYDPASCRVFASQDVTFDESVPFYRLFPYRTAPRPPPPLFLAPVTELVAFAAHCRLDYAARLVAESAFVCPPSVGGECALGTDVLEDRQEDLECLAAAAPHLVSMLLAPEGDPDAPDIPTPRSYAEAIAGEYSSQWQTAMDAEMASRKSTGTYVDEVPPPGANIVSGMWIFRVKRPPGSPPVLKARYVARGFNLGELRSYLGFQITRDRARRTITLTQSHMVQQVLQRFGFTWSSAQATPLATGHSLPAPPLDESVEPSGPYPELVGCLMYLMTCTRPDLAYPLGLLARYVAPGRHRKVHMDAAKRVLRYLCNTLSMGLVLGGRGDIVLTGHSDASWVDDQATQQSSQGYTFSLGFGSVSWRSTRSSSVLGSSCEAEIYATAMAAQELRWLTYVLTDLGERPRSPPVLDVDNKATIALCQEHRLEHITKHIALRYFLARELQQRGQLRLTYVATWANTADIFTKALPPGDHQRFCTLLGLVPTLPHLL